MVCRYFVSYVTKYQATLSNPARGAHNEQNTLVVCSVLFGSAGTHRILSLHERYMFRVSIRFAKLSATGSTSSHPARTVHPRAGFFLTEQYGLSTF